MKPRSAIATGDGCLSSDEIDQLVAESCPAADYRDKRVLLIVPDSTRTAPVGPVFEALWEAIGPATQALDILVALGTHPPMSEAAICERLGFSLEARRTRYARVRFFNHAWHDPAALREVGVIGADEIGRLSEGRFHLDLPVRVNRRLFEYDHVILIGPVFPHEVVGFSGGNKYLFPGVGGPEVLNFFHWLSAIITNLRIIGNKWTPVRKVVDRAAALVTVPKLCFAMVVRGGGLAGLFFGSPESAWDAASDLSAKAHILRKQRAFPTILSCAPPMYEDLWTGGKCMYKLEPVLADDGELIIYAPHISELSVTHGHLIAKIGYHCRDYFLEQWDRFRDHPWGVLAHSTHVRGAGTFENGVERLRARVTLATRIPEAQCQAVNLGYRDPDTIHPPDFADREESGVLLVRKAGEILYRLAEDALTGG